MNREIGKNFTKGFIRENPIFKIMLGLCPTLAVTTSLINGLGMGIATTFVLLGSNVLVAWLKNVIPEKIRLPAFIVIIATFVTIVELLMKAFFPELSKSLGIFIPLIVVNCVILGRAEAFASRNPVFLSIVDALGMGLGFTFGLCIISGIRELLGAGTLFGYMVSAQFEPALFITLAPGALLVLGILCGLYNHYFNRSKI